MTNSTHHAYDLFDLYADDAHEEHSGIRIRQLRRRRPPQLVFMMGVDEEPSSIYVSYIGASRRYYLGTRFASGVIPASDWGAALQRDGAPLEVITEIAGWLSERAL